VLISPNNPTGAVYPPATIHAFFELGEEARHRPAARRDLQGLPAEGTRPHELFSDPTWRGTLVHLYSFSKVFALTGYRVGGVTAGAALMAEIEKAMDCVSICPPRLGQEAALYGLRNLLPWARKNTEG
jgi:aspartate/methionine/tyrosine aminotransferase